MTNNFDKKMEEVLKNVGDMSLKRRARKIIEGLDLKNKEKILDLGCGDGFYIHMLTQLPVKLDITGFDYDQVVLKNARKNLGTKKVKLVSGTAEKMPFKNNTFDKIIMTEVLEHVEDDKKALKEVHRILKKNGILTFTVPSYNFPFLWDPINWGLQKVFNKHIGGIGFFAGIWAYHLRLYKKKNLINLFKQADFKIEKVEELTTRALPFNHYLVNIVARFLYDIKPAAKYSDPISKFKNVNKPTLIKVAFFLVNLCDKLNDIFPGKNGLNIYIKAKK